MLTIKHFISCEVMNMLILNFVHRVMKVPCQWSCAPIVSSSVTGICNSFT